MAQADFTRISTNIAALNTLNSLRKINGKLGNAQLRLATGKRINQASDDPAGLTIALKMSARNGGLKAALGNIGDAKNMLAVGESGLQQISDILTEMKGKATSAATETLGTEERGAIKTQIQSLAQQIDDIVNEATWNDEKLLGNFAGGALSMSKTLQTGAGVTDTTTWSVSTDHRATQAQGLNLATTSETATTSVTSGTTVDSSFEVTNSGTGVTLSSSTWLSELSTGSYELEVLAKAASAAIGYGAKDGGAWDATTSSITAEAPVLDELGSGRYRLHMDSGATATALYSVYNADTGALVFTNSTTAVDLTADGGASILDDTGTSTIGIKIENENMAAGDDIYFDYVAKGEIKMQLSEVNADSTTTVMAVDANGANGTGTDATVNSFYMDVGAGTATYDTGFGITANMKIITSITAGHKSQFDYTESGVSIALNSAAAASTFMTRVDNAISRVTDSLNGIGSLVARLDVKEEAVGVAQVNVEAAYNRIVNADMAHEQVQASKFQILQQTAIAMLAQSNMAPQGILSLFR